MNYYYANPRNNFWKVLLEVGFIKSEIKPNSDTVKRELNYHVLTRFFVLPSISQVASRW
ncbi:MAG: hypothetical protein WC415_03190 [Patescibacteria group bacterium]